MATSDEAERSTPTIVDVARAAAVSPATASRVVTGSARVRPELAVRVRAAVAELGYVPDEAARARRRGSLRAVGFVAPGLTEAWTGGIYAALRRELGGARLALAAVEAGDAPAGVHALAATRPEAVVIADDASGEALAALAGSGIPTVGYGGGGRRTDSFAAVDFESGMRELTLHLIDLGHRELVLLSGPRRRASDRSIADGFASGAGGADADARAIEASEWTPAAAFAALLPVLAGPRRPTAIAAYDPHVAAGAIAAARALGLAVPTDLSVAAFWDLTASSTRLTSLGDAPGAVSAAVARLIRDPGGEIVVALPVAAGETTAPARRRRPRVAASR